MRTPQGHLILEERPRCLDEHPEVPDAFCIREETEWERSDCIKGRATYRVLGTLNDFDEEWIVPA